VPDDIHNDDFPERTGRGGESHRVLVGGPDLNFRSVTLPDPVPTGRQLLDAAGARPAEEHLVFQLLPNGELEELRLDETTDLRARGIERFVVFRESASWRIEIDGRVLEWGAEVISGRTLKSLAGVDPDRYGLWLEVRGAGDDRPITNDELVRVSEPGLERFFTGIQETTEGCEP
jgi:hypothetical protein